MDTNEDHSMFVHFNKVKSYRFKECVSGLYNLDIYDPEIVPLTTKEIVSDYYYLSTVYVNMEYFTCADIEGADRDHDLLHIIGWTSDQHLINVLNKNLIINCTVLSYDDYVLILFTPQLIPSLNEK